MTPGMQVRVVNSYDADSLAVSVSRFNNVDYNIKNKRNYQT